MQIHRTVGQLFAEEPAQYGLRGDYYLWIEMRIHLDTLPLPASPTALVSIVEAAYRHLTGQSIDSGDRFSVERYAHGGISSGYVSPNFWKHRAIPLLIARGFNHADISQSDDGADR